MAIKTHENATYGLSLSPENKQILTSIRIPHLIKLK